MSVEEWAAVITIVAGFITWMVRLERRMGAMLTREEHDVICKQRAVDLKDDLAELRKGIDERHDENKGSFAKLERLIELGHAQADTSRHRVQDQVNTLSVKVGTIQGRLGIPEFQPRGPQGEIIG